MIQGLELNDLPNITQRGLPPGLLVPCSLDGSTLSTGKKRYRFPKAEALKRDSIWAKLLLLSEQLW